MTKLTTTVKLTGVHLCCQGCVNAVRAAIESVPGVQFRCDTEEGSVTLRASDEATAQKTLDAIAAAGFYGTTDDQKLAMKAMSDIPRDKVNSLKVSGIHNCCGPCCDAISQAILMVEGVTGTTAKPRATAFEVTGHFCSAEVVKALNDAGFSARVSSELQVPQFA
jgi:copper chaperone CopZ